MLKFAGICLLSVVVSIIDSLVVACGVMILWNMVLIDLMGTSFNPITFTHAFILALFVKLIFGGRQ